MKRSCDICGCEADEHWMMSYYAGSKTVWLCWACFKNSQYEANKANGVRQKRLHKMHERKKR